jgi:hypothetical protein
LSRLPADLEERCGFRAALDVLKLATAQERSRSDARRAATAQPTWPMA